MRLVDLLSAIEQPVRVHNDTVGAARAEATVRPGSDGAAERIVQAALQRLVVGGPAAVRLLLSPGELLKQGLRVSRDTAYRAVRDDVHSAAYSIVVSASARAASDADWSGALHTATEMAHAYVRQDDEVDASDDRAAVERLRAALLADVVASFDSPGWPAGYLLHAAAISCSPRWSGDRPTGEDLELGRQLLADRLAHYTALTDLYAPLLQTAMADMGLRPSGRSARSVLRLVHCLLDGAVLRMFIDPDLHAEDVADAMLRLGIALGEPGSFDDPRRPRDDVRREVFDRLIRHARAWWIAAPAAALDTVSIAAAASTSPEAMVMLLPTDADVADSVLREELAGAVKPPEAVPAESVFAPTAALALLRRIARTADRFPAARDVLLSHGPVVGSRAVDDTADVLALMLAASSLGEAQIRELNDAAWRGTAELEAMRWVVASIGADLPASPRI